MVQSRFVSHIKERFRWKRDYLIQGTVVDFPEKLDKTQKKKFQIFKVVPVNILNRALPVWKSPGFFPAPHLGQTGGP